MRSLSLSVFILVLFSVVISSLGADAQNPTTPQGGFVIGINIDSNYPPIRAFLPRLREVVVKEVGRPKQSIDVIALHVPTQDATGAGKNAGCDYLLQMSVNEMSGGAGSVFANAGGSAAFTTLPQVRVVYRLLSLKNNSIDMSSNYDVPFGEYPTVGDASSLETTVSRVVIRVADQSVSALTHK